MRRWQPIPLVASGLGIPEQTIRTWVRRGQIEAVRRFDGVIYVDVAEVIDRRRPAA